MEGQRLSYFGPYRLDEYGIANDILKVSRSIFSDAKKLIESSKNSDEFRYTYKQKDDAEVVILISVTKADGNFMMKESGRMIAGMVTIDFVVNPEAFPMAYNDFNSQVKSVLSHELEHYQQVIGNRELDKPMAELMIGYSELPFYKYLMHPLEIPAWIRQVKSTAKHFKAKMSDVIDYELSKYQDKLTPNERKLVRKVWIKEGKKLFPKADWSKT